MGTMAFPFVYPGAYSRPQVLTTADLIAGWIHSPEPQVAVAGNHVQYDGPNQSPLDVPPEPEPQPAGLGDNLPDPSSGLGEFQTWWGFPTWRETLSPFWTDPTWQVNTNLSQPFGLAYQPANRDHRGQHGAVAPRHDGAIYRNTPSFTTTGCPTTPTRTQSPTASSRSPAASRPALEAGLGRRPDHDGVRSFDVKAYDNAYAGYADLGWGDDLRLYQPYNGRDSRHTCRQAAARALLHASVHDLAAGSRPNDRLYFTPVTQTFAHEGRMPPLQNDHRLRRPVPEPAVHRRPAITRSTRATQLHQQRRRRQPGRRSGCGGSGIPGPPSTRRRRATGLNPATSALPFFPAGPAVHAADLSVVSAALSGALRGIQIQIRVTDPTNQRIKTLTIRQDFTDKL